MKNDQHATYMQEASHGAVAQVCECQRNWLLVRFPPLVPRCLVLSGFEAKRSVEFRHSTPNASRIRQKVMNRVQRLNIVIKECCF